MNHCVTDEKSELPNIVMHTDNFFIWFE